MNDRAIYSAVHGKKVIRGGLLDAGRLGGWRHRSGVSPLASFESFERENWLLLVDWSDGGRIVGASLKETQIDPDTDRPRLQRDGKSVQRYLRYGMSFRERGKKETLIKILRTPDAGMRSMVNDLNERRLR